MYTALLNVPRLGIYRNCTVFRPSGVVTVSAAQYAYAQARKHPVLRPEDKHTFMQLFALTLFNALREPVFLPQLTRSTARYGNTPFSSLAIDLPYINAVQG